jgi:hypothetical protein
MVKFSAAKATSAIKGVLILLVGIIGAKAVKGLVESKFPQFASFTNYGVLAASLVGSTLGKSIVSDVAKGSLLFAAVQVVNQFIPATAASYMPQISGLGNPATVIPGPASYEATPSMLTLGRSGLGNSLYSTPG